MRWDFRCWMHSILIKTSRVKLAKSFRERQFSSQCVESMLERDWSSSCWPWLSSQFDQWVKETTVNDKALASWHAEPRIWLWPCPPNHWREQKCTWPRINQNEGLIFGWVSSKSMDIVADRQRYSQVMETPTLRTKPGVIKWGVSVFNRMSFRDFQENFSCLFICNQFPINLDHGNMPHESWSQTAFKDHVGNYSARREAASPSSLWATGLNGPWFWTISPKLEGEEFVSLKQQLFFSKGNGCWWGGQANLKCASPTPSCSHLPLSFYWPSPSSQE